MLNILTESRIRAISPSDKPQRVFDGGGLYLEVTRGDGRVMSDMPMGAALRRLGFSSDEMTAHGFRAMARTMLVERLDYDESIVEAQLAHRVRDALGRAYNRTQFVDQRRTMSRCGAIIWTG